MILNHIKTSDMHSEAKFQISHHRIYQKNISQKKRKWLIGLVIGITGLSFVPWTQNIKSKAFVTTFNQDEKPQEIHSAIAGKIIKWYVREGQEVSPGDTLVQLQEVKMEYLDPHLLERTKQQIISKSRAIENYSNKVSTTEQQHQALEESLKLKLDQTRLKILQTKAKLLSDSMEFVAAINDYNIASEQYERQLKMFSNGLVSQTQLEQRNQTLQTSNAKKISSEMKLLNTRQELTNLNYELQVLSQEYTEKMLKIDGDRFQTLSSIALGEAEIAKLENLYSNYNIRSGMYYVIASQQGQVYNIRIAGNSEIIKEGESLLSIVPTQAQMALELFISPMDQPLIQPNQLVRIIFDGYPALIFSGWPNQSFGTFQGKVITVENRVNSQGLFRVLVSADHNYKKWPSSLRYGNGASTITLLNDVPIIYEFWRQINGFPADFYKPNANAK